MQNIPQKKREKTFKQPVKNKKKTFIEKSLQK